MPFRQRQAAWAEVATSPSDVRCYSNSAQTVGLSEADTLSRKYPGLVQGAKWQCKPRRRRTVSFTYAPIAALSLQLRDRRLSMRRDHGPLERLKPKPTIAI